MSKLTRVKPLTLVKSVAPVAGWGYFGPVTPQPRLANVVVRPADERAYLTPGRAARHSARVVRREGLTVEAVAADYAATGEAWPICGDSLAR